MLQLFKRLGRYNYITCLSTSRFSSNISKNISDISTSKTYQQFLINFLLITENYWLRVPILLMIKTCSESRYCHVNTAYLLIMNTSHFISAHTLMIAQRRNPHPYLETMLSVLCHACPLTSIIYIRKYHQTQFRVRIYNKIINILFGNISVKYNLGFAFNKDANLAN